MKVLITDRFDFKALMLLKAQKGLEVEQSSHASPTDSELAGAHALIIRSRTKITKELLARAPQLKFVVTATSGFDHIDLKAASEKNITLAYTPEANAQSAAELTWALVLAAAKRLPEADRAIRSGNWAREALTGLELRGKTYGVIGLGRVGKRVALIAKAFGMQILAYDPYIEDEDFSQAHAQRSGLDDLIRLSDVVSLHVPKTAETSPLIRPWHFEVLMKHAIMVNTSRGTAIDEAGLIAALTAGRIRTCGLDVFEREPLPVGSALLTLPQIVLTPHLGATTEDAFALASEMAAQKLIAFFAGTEITDRLPPDAEWYGRHFGPK